MILRLASQSNHESLVNSYIHGWREGRGRVTVSQAWNLLHCCQQMKGLLRSWFGGSPCDRTRTPEREHEQLFGVVDSNKARPSYGTDTFLGQPRSCPDLNYSLLILEECRGTGSFDQRAEITCANDFVG